MFPEKAYALRKFGVDDDNPSYEDFAAARLPDYDPGNTMPGTTNVRLLQRGKSRRVDKFLDWVSELHSAHSSHSMLIDTRRRMPFQLLNAETSKPCKCSSMPTRTIAAGSLKRTPLPSDTFGLQTIDTFPLESSSLATRVILLLSALRVTRSKPLSERPSTVVKACRGYLVRTPAINVSVLS